MHLCIYVSVHVILYIPCPYFKIIYWYLITLLFWHVWVYLIWQPLFELIVVLKMDLYDFAGSCVNWVIKWTIMPATILISGLETRRDTSSLLSDLYNPSLYLYKNILDLYIYWWYMQCILNQSLISKCLAYAYIRT